MNFFGLIFSVEGIRPDPGKLEALHQATPPQSKSELKSFLDMVNFSSVFIEDYSTLTAPL